MLSGWAAVQILDNLIAENQASYGAGLALGGNGTLTVRNNLIVDNVAGAQSAAFEMYSGGDALIVDNVITGNRAPEIAAAKITVLSSTGRPYFVNNTFSDNTSPGSDISVIVGDNDARFDNNIATDDVECTGSRAPTFVANNVSTVSGLCAGIVGANGNTSADPQFVDTVNDDYRLRLGSPSINAGDNAAPGLPATDIAGKPRVSEGVVDQGAYEYYVHKTPLMLNNNDPSHRRGPLAFGAGGAGAASESATSSGSAPTMASGSSSSTAADEPLTPPAPPSKALADRLARYRNESVLAGGEGIHRSSAPKGSEPAIFPTLPFLRGTA